jgi:hypothetical protein
LIFFATHTQSTMSATPVFDSVLTAQHFTEDSRFWLKAMFGRFLCSEASDEWNVTPVLLGAPCTGKTTLLKLLQFMSKQDIDVLTKDTVKDKRARWIAFDLHSIAHAQHLLKDTTSTRGLIAASSGLSTQGSTKLLIVFPFVHRPESIDIDLYTALKDEASVLEKEFSECYNKAQDMLGDASFWACKGGFGSQLENVNAVALVT